MKLQTLLIILCCGAAFGQSQSKLTIDYTENNRWCRDDAAVKRQCNIAYGHYTVTEATEWHTKPTTYRIVLLCQPAGQELGRKDCLPLEGVRAMGGTMLIATVVLTTATGTNSTKIT
jgi:hypothetical protein